MQHATNTSTSPSLDKGRCTDTFSQQLEHFDIRSRLLAMKGPAFISALSLEINDSAPRKEKARSPWTDAGADDCRKMVMNEKVGDEKSPEMLKRNADSGNNSATSTGHNKLAPGSLGPRHPGLKPMPKMKNGLLSSHHLAAERDDQQDSSQQKEQQRMRCPTTIHAKKTHCEFHPLQEQPQQQSQPQPAQVLSSSSHRAAHQRARRHRSMDLARSTLPDPTVAMSSQKKGSGIAESIVRCISADQEVGMVGAAGGGGFRPARQSALMGHQASAQMDRSMHSAFWHPPSSRSDEQELQPQPLRKGRHSRTASMEHLTCRTHGTVLPTMSSRGAGARASVSNLSSSSGRRAQTRVKPERAVSMDHTSPQAGHPWRRSRRSSSMDHVPSRSLPVEARDIMEEILSSAEVMDVAMNGMNAATSAPALRADELSGSTRGGGRSKQRQQQHKRHGSPQGSSMPSNHRSESERGVMPMLVRAMSFANAGGLPLGPSSGSGSGSGSAIHLSATPEIDVHDIINEVETQVQRDLSSSEHGQRVEPKRQGGRSALDTLTSKLNLGNEAGSTNGAVVAAGARSSGRVQPTKGSGDGAAMEEEKEDVFQMDSRFTEVDGMITLASIEEKPSARPGLARGLSMSIFGK